MSASIAAIKVLILALIESKGSDYSCSLQIKSVNGRLIRNDKKLEI